MPAMKPQLRVIEGKGKPRKQHNPATPKDRLTIIFTAPDVEDNFDPDDVSLGLTLVKNKHVRECHLSHYQSGSHRQQLTGLVENHQRSHSYRVTVTASIDDEDIEDDAVLLEGECSCPDSVDCCHAAALLYQAMVNYGYHAPNRTPLSAYDMLQKQSKALQPPNTSRNSLSQWSEALSAYQKKKAVPNPQDDEALVYLVKRTSDNQQGPLELTLERAKTVKRGGYGKSRELSLLTSKAKAMMTPADKAILNQVYALQDNPELNKSRYTFLLNDCDALFDALMTSGKAYWEQTGKYALRQGAPCALEARWQMHANGEQRLAFYPPNSDIPSPVMLLPTNPIWYVDPSTHQLGKVETSLSADTLMWLLQLPAIPPAQVAAAQQQLTALLPDRDALPALQQIEHLPVADTLQPSVNLRLYGKALSPDPYDAAARFMGNYDRRKRHLLDFIDNEALSTPTVALAECQFDYEGHAVSLADGADQFDFYREGKVHTIVRNREFERQCVDKLSAAGLEAAAMQPKLLARDKGLQFAFIINDDVDDEAVIAEQLSSLQSVAAQEGWHIVLDPSFPARVIHEVDEWYTDLEDNSSGIDWFGMSLGVVVEGEQVNILPLLLKEIDTQFKDLDPRAIKVLPDDTPCELRMDNGEYLKIPFPRIRNILLVLCELFEEKPLDEKGRLRLSRLKASLLPEIEKAVGATRLRWFGDAKLKQFGQKLANFTGIKTVKPAKKFTATLRPYQQEGLNWLQFLREYGLNGILADEMGLGKTIQTLAHLSVEKQAKRLKGPSLLIAPTSLMTNWENEAARFSPELSILILHGSKRHVQFEQIEKADIVFTTYPLIIRDKETLLSYNFQYLILDEAHQIKNPQAKMTQVILQLKAERRLCLTGTPMENHLGELWSLFHFILPGLLGTKHQFGHIYRTPIEKQGDTFRHQQLIQRIKPFMLRRRKDEVVKDLPAKTEIIRKVEFAQDQRDLYESVRLSMEKKVRKIVDAQGINRSQIIILDALLKLRQICCAPSLLKLTQAKKVKQSAKLEDLMEFLPSLIEEGRRILLFSTFTSMLSLVEKELDKQKIPHVILTGQTKDRKTPINRFQHKEVPLFLISLKAGGIGLNLTAADTVIHYDPWWNPAAEQQATDRAHRIGQKNPVFVYKMIVEGTVEERIIEMQAKKREIIDSVLDGNKQAKLSLTQKDLDNLFKPVQ